MITLEDTLQETIANICKLDLNEFCPKCLRTWHFDRSHLNYVTLHKPASYYFCCPKCFLVLIRYRNIDGSG